jgi:hypothetical protein
VCSAFDQPVLNLEKRPGESCITWILDAARCEPADRSEQWILSRRG